MVSPELRGLLAGGASGRPERNEQAGLSVSNGTHDSSRHRVRLMPKD